MFKYLFSYYLGPTKKICNFYVTHIISETTFKRKIFHDLIIQALYNLFNFDIKILTLHYILKFFIGILNLRYLNTLYFRVLIINHEFELLINILILSLFIQNKQFLILNIKKSDFNLRLKLRLFRIQAGIFIKIKIYDRF